MTYDSHRDYDERDYVDPSDRWYEDEAIRHMVNFATGEFFDDEEDEDVPEYVLAYVA